MKVEKEHKNIVRLSVTIAMFVLLIFGASYAIIEQRKTYASENITASLGTRPVFTSTVTNSIVMNEIPFIAQTSTTEYEIANATDTLSLALSTNYTTNTTCTYDIVWEWDTTSNGYTKTSGATKEFTVSGTSNDSDSFAEVQLNNYSSSNLTTTLKSGASITANGSTIKNQTWTFTVRFYKTKAIQTNHQGKSYPGKIKATNVVCSNAGEGSSSTSSAPTSYWYGTSGTYTFPNYGGTLQTSGTATGHNVYIGQDDSKYYACATIQGKEVCLSLPYTQYTGSEIVNNSLSTEQHNAAKAAIGEVFSDAGITGYSCASGSGSAGCGVDGIGCSVYAGGGVNCNFQNDICSVDAGGSASCVLAGVGN